MRLGNSWITQFQTFFLRTFCIEVILVADIKRTIMNTKKKIRGLDKRAEHSKKSETFVKAEKIHSGIETNLNELLATLTSG